MGLARHDRTRASIRIFLSDPQLISLEHAFRVTTDRKLRDRAQIVLLAHRGRPHKGIAADLGVTPRTVQRWLNAYTDRGLGGLRPREAPGAAPKLTPDLGPVLRRWVTDGPVKQGLDRANWTYAELADHLHKATGIRVGTSAMQAFCRKHDIRPYRPTYRFPRGDPAKQATARGELAALKRWRTPANASSRARTRPGSRWSRPSAAPSGPRGTARPSGRGAASTYSTSSRR